MKVKWIVLALLLLLPTSAVAHHDDDYVQDRNQAYDQGRSDAMMGFTRSGRGPDQSAYDIGYREYQLQYPEPPVYQPYQTPNYENGGTE